MADVIVKIRVMPESPEIDLNNLHKEIDVLIKGFGSRGNHNVTQEPVAFGLKALVFLFMIDEKKSNLDELENKIRAIPGINSAEVVDVRRATG
jgi:elongation factor 1-beta